MQFPSRYQQACKNNTAESFSELFYAAESEKCIENPKSQRQEAQVVECVDGCARITLKELAPLHSVKNGIFQNACSTSPKNGCRFGEECSCAHRQDDEQPSDKSAVAMLKITRQLGCVFQDMEPPKSSSILRKSLNILKPIQRVKFTKAVARQAKIRDQNPSLGMICPGEPHERNPNAPKFEDWSPEETEWQEQGAREAACKVGPKCLKI